MQKFIEPTFEIVLYESLPAYWEMQFDMLVNLKYIFDHIKSRGATVVFPNRTLRHPTPETEVLVQLMRIESVEEGLQIWVQYLKERGRIALTDLDWWTAFTPTRKGFRIVLTHAQDENFTTASRQTLTWQEATKKMTRLMGKAFGVLSAQKACKLAFRDVIRQTATSLLLEPIPLNFAINNYSRLMKTSYDAGTDIETVHVALHAIHEGRKYLTNKFDHKVRIVIVTDTIPNSHTKCLLRTSEQFQRVMNQYRKIQNGAEHAYGISFVSLPATGSTDIWRNLVRPGSGINVFCHHLELPIDISCIEEMFVRKLLWLKDM